MEQYYKNNKGQSLFEVVVAVGLISIVLITLVATSALTIRSTTFARNQGLAVRYNEQALEWLRGEKEAGWNTFWTKASSGSFSGYCLQNLSWANSQSSPCPSIPGTVFTRVLYLTAVTDITGNSYVSILINTSWSDSQGGHIVNAPLNLYDWK